MEDSATNPHIFLGFDSLGLTSVWEENQRVSYKDYRWATGMLCC